MSDWCFLTIPYQHGLVLKSWSVPCNYGNGHNPLTNIPQSNRPLVLDLGGKSEICCVWLTKTNIETYISTILEAKEELQVGKMCGKFSCLFM